MKTVHCLFEQSGTFKNEFKKLGINAYDYDVLNEFGETDYQIDLFKEIRGGYDGKPSIFDKIAKDDLILAFFPCTRFEARVPLLFRGEAFQQKKWSIRQKMEYSIQLHEELNELYVLISKLVCIAEKRKLKLIIENPYTQPHYLTTPGYVMKATREHKKIKNKWTTIRSDRELTDTRRKIITRQRKQKIVGSAAVKRTTSAGRTYCLPKWKEF